MLIQDEDWHSRVRAVTKLFSLLCDFVHHQESAGFRATFIVPLFLALKKDVDVWFQTKARQSELLPQTLSAIKAKIDGRWKGMNDSTGKPIVGLHSPQHLMSYLVDPLFCPKSEELPSNWRDECKKIVKRFCPNDQDQESAQKHQAAMSQLEALVLHEGRFGELVESLQEEMETVTGPPKLVAARGWASRFRRRWRQ